MSDNSSNAEIIGETIEMYSVIGEERSLDGLRVGADVAIHTRVGSFLINVMTRDEYKVQILKTHVDDVERPELLLLDSINPRRREPYVVNVQEVTDEVLGEELSGRVIDEDLAGSIFGTDKTDSSD